MQTKTIELYEFEELPEEVQAKVLDNERYINVEDSFWYDYDGKTGFSSKELKRMRVNPKDAPDELITYKTMYFDIDRAWYIQFIDPQWADDEVARKFLRVPKKLWEMIEWTFINNNYGGNNHGTTELSYEYAYWHRGTAGDFTPKQIEILDRAVEILDRAVEIFSDKMEEVLRSLHNQYEYFVSDEGVKETILANEYTFTATGKMENL